MAGDEASIRIVLEGDGGESRSPGAAPRFAGQGSAGGRVANRPDPAGEPIHKAIDKFRTTIGGLFGRLIGRLVDIATSFRRIGNDISRPRQVEFGRLTRELASGLAKAPELKKITEVASPPPALPAKAVPVVEAKELRKAAQSLPPPPTPVSEPPPQPQAKIDMAARVNRARRLGGELVPKPDSKLAQETRDPLIRTPLQPTQQKLTGQELPPLEPSLWKPPERTKRPNFGGLPDYSKAEARDLEARREAARKLARQRQGKNAPEAIPPGPGSINLDKRLGAPTEKPKQQPPTPTEKVPLTFNRLMGMNVTTDDLRREVFKPPKGLVHSEKELQEKLDATREIYRRREEGGGKWPDMRGGIVDKSGRGPSAGTGAYNLIMGGQSPDLARGQNQPDLYSGIMRMGQGPPPRQSEMPKNPRPPENVFDLLGEKSRPRGTGQNLDLAKKGIDLSGVKAPNLAGGADAIQKSGGLMEAMGAAAGPVAAVTAALAVFKETLNGTTASAGRFMATMVSSSDKPEQFVGRLSDSVKSAGDSLFFISPAASIFISQIGAMGQALGAVMSEISGMADRYSAYNPNIAMAQAVADMRQTIGDFRRAQEAGPDLVNYIERSSQMQQRIEDMKIRALHRLLPVVEKGMDEFEKLLPIAEAVLGVIVDMQQAFGNQPQRQTDTLESLRELLESPEAAELPTTQVRAGYPFAPPVLPEGAI